jgi:hypothetical protein
MHGSHAFPDLLKKVRGSYLLVNDKRGTLKGHRRRVGDEPMATIVLLALTGDVEPAFRIPLWAKRFVNALVASRAEAAVQELCRHRALVQDLGADEIRLSRSEILPFTV